MPDISGFGFRVRLIASVTFPAGFDIEAFADDTDPFDMPSQQLADKAMGLNGDMASWSTANPLLTTLSIMPGTTDDENMKILANSNRVGKGKQSNRDVITLVGIYPSGKTISLVRGRITDAPLGDSIASAGRLKSNTYGFAFENLVTT